MAPNWPSPYPYPYQSSSYTTTWSSFGSNATNNDATIIYSTHSNDANRSFGPTVEARPRESSDVRKFKIAVARTIAAIRLALKLARHPRALATFRPPVLRMRVAARQRAASLSSAWRARAPPSCMPA
jgi:hypothetical protein